MPHQLRRVGLCQDPLPVGFVTQSPTPRRGRPTKLSDRERAEIGRRLALGESKRALAREFKVSEAFIRSNFSAHVAEIKNVATRLAGAELDLQGLPISAQASVRSLTDQLKGLGKTIIETAALNGETARIMSTRALEAASALESDAGLQELMLPGAFIEVSNKAASLGVQLMNSQKDAVKGHRTLEDIIVGQGTEHPGLAESIRKARLRVVNTSTGLISEQ